MDKWELRDRDLLFSYRDFSLTEFLAYPVTGEYVSLKEIYSNTVNLHVIKNKINTYTHMGIMIGLFSEKHNR